MKLIYVRHGKTEFNKEGRFQGQIDTELSAEGLAQAEKISSRLRDEKIDIIYSSDLHRAQQTTELIARHHSNVKIITTRDLTERDYGSLEGKKKTEVPKDAHLTVDDGESLDALFSRAEQLLEKTYNAHPSETVLFSSHGRLGRALVCVITGKKPENIYDENLKNGSISIFEIKKEKDHRIHVFNCDKHLLTRP
ncbi:MAG: histidine phosphatase family protein [archaeon]